MEILLTISKKVRHLVDLFGRQRKGFFIEAGAYDGEMISNKLYLEKKMGWTGLLVEPNPDAFAELVNKKGEHIYSDIACQPKQYQVSNHYKNRLIARLLERTQKFARTRKKLTKL